MKRFYLFAFILSIAVLTGCGANKFNAGDLPEKQLVFGRGGGFSGAFKEYTLLENGQLFVRNNVEGNQQELRALSRGDARRAFKRFEKAANIDRSASRSLQEMPGNLYEFIAYRSVDGQFSMTWEPSTGSLNQDLEDLHGELMEKVQDRN